MTLDDDANIVAVVDVQFRVGGPDSSQRLFERPLRQPPRQRFEPGNAGKALADHRQSERDPAALAGPAAYRLVSNAPCLGAGLIIEDNGGRDFWGNPVPKSERPAVGACEKPQT